MSPPSTTPDHPYRARTVRVLAALVLGVVGGWLGITVAGAVRHEIGPLNTTMRLEPAWEGGTVVEIPPLGELVLATHRGPLGLRATLDGLDAGEARLLVAEPDRIATLKPQAVEDLRWALTMAAVQAGAATTLGALALGGLATRRVSGALLAGGTGLVAVGSSIAFAVSTANPAALAEPRYTGLLTGAPSVVGSAESIITDFSRYGDQLAQIVRNVSGLYAATSNLPVLGEPDETVKLLQVSDLHLAPQAWDLIRTVAVQYDVDAIVDSGDITDHGSAAENRYVEEIRHLPVPYVWVRGNHDSMTTQRAMRKLKNVVVLDGRPREVAGLTFVGLGDPTFTPDKSGDPADRIPRSVDVTGPADLVAGAGARLASVARDHGNVDVAVFHDATKTAALDGTAAMVMQGHLHYRKVTQGERGTWFLQQGSTGGSGLRALEPEEPAPILLSVVYVDRETGALHGYDDIRLGGLGSASAQINRQVIEATAADEALGPPSLDGRQAGADRGSRRRE